MDAAGRCARAVVVVAVSRWASLVVVCVCMGMGGELEAQKVSLSGGRGRSYGCS